MAARIDNGRAQLLTRTRLDWTDKYLSAIAALADVKAKTAYIDRELCGVDDAGLPSFANTQAAADGERGVRLVYYAFDLLHLDGWDVSDPRVAFRATRHSGRRDAGARLQLRPVALAPAARGKEGTEKDPPKRFCAQ